MKRCGSENLPEVQQTANGSLGVTYTVADNTSNTTMYVAGRLATDPPGMMRPPQRIISGPTTDGRWGDYSSCVVDINSSGISQNTFWACNEYLTSSGQFNWKDRLANFSLDSESNFGFELPHLGPGSYLYNPGREAWTFNGSSGSGSGLVANGSGFGNPNAPEGVQAAFVQSYGIISQTLSGFTPGTVYTITYSAAQRSGGNQHGGESWNVDVDNSPIKSNSPGSTSYTTYTATFTATSVTHSLSFVGTDLVGGDNTVFIDNVRISPALNPMSPSLTVTSPASNNVYVALATVNLSAAVTTGGNRINGVQFYSDGLYAGQVTNVPYNYALVNVGSGIHIVVARLNFNDGSSIDSTPVIYYVINRNPNYGFEIPSLGSHNYQYTPAGGFWTFTGSAGNGSGILANGSAFSNPNAPEGVQAGFIQGHGAISQVLSGFNPGTSYTITYSAAQRPGNSESWNVEIDNNVIKSNNPAGTSYVTYTASFVASAVTHTLSFVGTDLAGGDNTVFLDNVSINPPITPEVVKLMPVLTRDTSPATATTVVGDEIAFTAGFSNSPAAYYQWQFINNGKIADIPGATNSALTLTNLQLTDGGSYRLEAINATNNQGVGYSTASPLTINNVPAAVNNIIACFAAQTGLGSVLTNFVPTWTVMPGSLISGQSPSSIGPGNFSDPNANECGTVAGLTDGAFGQLNFWPNVGGSSTEVTCGTNGGGQWVAYTLTTGTNGYNLTNITVYGGWGDAGRDQQAYTIYYSKATASGTFIPLSPVSYNPSNPLGVQSATRATLTPANGYLATNVAAVKFDFTTPTPENGYCGYSEIQVFGVANLPPAVPTTISAIIASTGRLIVSIGSLVAGRTYEVQSTTNLVSPVWVTETNFMAGAASASVTNSISTDGQKFYRVVGF